MFIVLFVIALFLKDSSETVIHMEKELELFRDCTIHVSLHGLNNKISFEVEPLKIPIILSETQYSETGTHPQGLYGNSKYVCGKYLYSIQNIQGFKFRSQPSPRQICVVLVYVNPKHCVDWKLLKSPIPQTSSFPDGFMDPVVDYTREAYESEYDVEKLTINKEGHFIIHVKQPLPQSVDKTKLDVVKDIHLYLGIIWKYAIPGSIIYESTPTFITFEVSESDDCDCLVVSQEYVVEYGSYSGIREKVSFNEKLPDDTDKRNSIIRRPTFQSYRAERRMTSIKHSDLQSFKFEFRGATWIALSQAQPFVTGIKAPYFLDHTKPGIGIKMMLISLVSPNSTFLPKALELQNEWVYPIFDHVDKPFRDSFLSKTSDHKQLHFITCAPYEELGMLSASGFISAFDIYIWVALFSTAVISGGAISILKYFHYLLSRNDRNENLAENITLFREMTLVDI